MSQIQKLEARVQKKFSKSQNLLNAPELWEDFVKLTKIRSGNQMVNFKPFDYQPKLVQLMQRYSVVQVVKSRQLGITQTALSYYLKKAINNQAYQAIAFMKCQEDSSNLARRTRTMLDSIPKYAKAENDNLGFIKIQNGGAIHLKNSAKEGGRSYDSVEDFLYDEASFSPNIESIYGASSASSAMLGDIGCKLIISTPSAKIGWYWDKLASDNPDGIDPEIICQQVAKGELPPFYYWIDNLGQCKVIIHWKAHPIYSQRPDYLEYRQQKDGTSWEVVKREYDLCFVDSEVAVFSAELVRNCAVGRWNKILDPNADYYIGIDTSNLGDDFTVATVLKKVGDVYSVCDLYRKRKMSSEFDIFQISELIQKYKPRNVGVEVTGGTGQIYLEQLQKLNKGSKFEPIRTTESSKQAMVDRLILGLEKAIIEYPETYPGVEEMLTFRRQGNKLGASSGRHDDCILSLAFALTATPFVKDVDNPFKDLNLDELIID